MTALTHNLHKAKLDGLWKDLKNPTEEELQDIVTSIPYLARKAATRLIADYPSIDNYMLVIDKIGDRATHNIMSKPDKLCVRAFLMILDSEPRRQQLLDAIKLFRDRRTSGTKEHIEKALALLATYDLTKEELLTVIDSFVCNSSYGVQEQFIEMFFKLEKEPTNEELFRCLRNAVSLRSCVGQMILGNNPPEDDLLRFIGFTNHSDAQRDAAWDMLKKMGPSEHSLNRILVDARRYAYEAAEIWLTMSPSESALRHMIRYIDNGSLESSSLHVSICERLMTEYPDERTFPYVIFYCKEYEVRVRAARNWLKLKRGNPNRNQVRRAVIHRMWYYPIAVEFARELLKHNPTEDDLRFLLETSLKQDKSGTIKSRALKMLRGKSPKDNQEIIEMMKDPTTP